MKRHRPNPYAKPREVLPFRKSVRQYYSVAWYVEKHQANTRGFAIRQRGDKVTGGFSEGALLGRAPEHDYVDRDHGPLYAVTYSLEEP